MKWLACAVCVIATVTLTASVSARTLAEVQARGAISLCANPDALPYASNQSDKPGFQIEIGRALAEGLGVKLQVDWIVPRIRAGLVDCDMLLDTIVDPDLARGPIKVSHAYQRSGVALALAPGSEGIQRFSDIAPGKRVGVMVNSVASKVLNQRGIYTVPYAFESDMIADLAEGVDGFTRYRLYPRYQGYRRSKNPLRRNPRAQPPQWALRPDRPVGLQCRHPGTERRPRGFGRGVGPDLAHQRDGLRSS